MKRIYFQCLWFLAIMLSMVCWLAPSALAGWKATGTMITPRQFHTATLLNNGKVLITGGWDNSSAKLNSAEIYDPTTGTFSPTRDMSLARAFHTATLLGNGEVLIAGGSDQCILHGGQCYEQCELYDPTNETFIATGEILSRSQHAAQIFGVSDVLISGGIHGPGYTITADAVIYDSVKDTFSSSYNPMNFARSGHTATSLGSEIIIIGGALKAEEFLGTGGDETNRFEISRTASDTIVRVEHTATYINTPDSTENLGHKILVVGGNSASGILQSAYLYIYHHNDQDEILEVGSLNTPRRGHTATLLSDKSSVLIAGGLGPSEVLSSVEIYDHKNNVFSNDASMLTARYGHTATLLPNQKVLVTGGRNSLGYVEDSAELYCPSLFAGGFELTKDHLYDAGDFGGEATLLKNGWVLITGGYNAPSELSGHPVDAASLYRWDQDDFFLLPVRMNQARSEHTATLLSSGEVLITGGTQNKAVGNSGNLATAELYDSSLNFTGTGSMEHARAGHTATALQNGQVLMIGGYGNVVSRGGLLCSAEVYDPTAKQFSPAGTVAIARVNHTATLLNNGKVLITGGEYCECDDTERCGVAGSAYLYDPSNRTFSPTGWMNIPRYGHTASLMKNGNVLIVGGKTIKECEDPECYVDWVELYNVATEKFEVVTRSPFVTEPLRLADARAFHTATVLDSGEILIAGGRTSKSDINGFIWRGLEEAELFYFARTCLLNTCWNEPHLRKVSSLNYSKVSHTATPLPNGKILMVEGRSSELYRREICKPFIGGVYHNAGPQGEGAWIWGYNFGEDQDKGKVTFNNVEGSILSWHEGLVVSPFPTTLIGDCEVTAWVDGEASNSVPYYIPGTGDVNRDKKYNILDVLTILKAVLGSGTVPLCSDVNDDDKVDILDSLLTLQISWGLKQPAQCWDFD
jgi:hypothetical protein